MKGRVQVIHKDQDRDLEDGDQRRKSTVSQKGNTQGYTKMEGEMKMRVKRGRGEDEDENKNEDEDGMKTRRTER